MTSQQNGNGNGSNGNGQLVPFQTRVNNFRGLLEKLKPQIALALPKHIKAERLARIVLTSVQKTPDLLLCTQESLLGCIIQAAQLGLEPDGMLGHAYLIPYSDRKKGGKVCQLIVGYKGMLKLARQSGEIASISAHVVYAKDEFDYSFGLNETLTHRPARPPLVTIEKEGQLPWEGPDPEWYAGGIVAAYAVAILKDGTKQFDVMGRHDIDAIRDRSKASGDGPWVTDYPEMAKKTVLRRLCKMLPASIELQTAVALDERVDAGVGQELEHVIDVTATEVPSGAEGEAPPPPASKLDKLAAEKRSKADAGSEG
jgi:recombination protein RecT